MPISARNQIKGTVTRVTRGEAIANVEVDAHGVRLVASITSKRSMSLGSARDRGHRDRQGIRRDPGDLTAAPAGGCRVCASVVYANICSCAGRT